MKLVGDSVKLETKEDIDMLQTMIESYQKSIKLENAKEEMLNELNTQLDKLWYCW
ncbi:hypothetical protein [Anaerorhabdus sp.]|uniref:hypothetical protein n=1 Tax=Anaerorhabdus sp. TaxID=1872524 RepID=UPI002FCB9116